MQKQLVDSAMPGNHPENADGEIFRKGFLKKFFRKAVL